MAGQAFEKLALERLLRFLGPTAYLAPTGGAYDGGLDALGRWLVRGSSVAGETERFMQVALAVQCKRMRRAIGPDVVREFEGAVRNWQREQSPAATSFTRVSDVLGLICVSPRFTEAAITVANRNAVPLALVVLAHSRSSLPEAPERDEPVIAQFRFNAAARSLLPNVNIATKKIPFVSLCGCPAVIERLVLDYD
ncbi:hypothetical protein F1559_001854 [Cyanidiococcus yangmingshanensis]|uniref:Restriction endonuclease type IV Mrr domain-containing protein n=1 Tax=Cyanidiococcus yangmingshanensis TaxID=2690220 RepID=A0A7J7IPW6_9RHOD|nr:hypothetical protein F1559_001854 [Cyanidiococcus yangmingshanensis]